jgi:putative endopeptidase
MSTPSLSFRPWLLVPLILLPSVAAALDPKSMDLQAAPGSDFYEYANGTWIKDHPIPPEFSQWSTGQELRERNYSALREILDAAGGAVRQGEILPGSPRALVGQFYLSGMNEEKINAGGAKPLQTELDAIDKIADAKQLAPYVAHIHGQGIGALFEITGDQDAKESTSQIAIMTQGGLGLPNRDYYLKDDDQSKKLRDQYVEHVTKMFQLLGDPEQAAADNAKKVFALETELAKASKTPVELRSPEENYHKMTIAELEKQAGGFDWATYFDALELSKEQVTQIDVQQPDFFKRVGELVASTSVDTWKSYFRWNLIRRCAPYLSEPFVDENFRFYKQVLTGVKENQPRWKRVLVEIDSDVGEALGQLYVEKYFPPAAKKRVLDMANDLKAALREKIKNLAWLGKETRAAALKKLDAFGVKIGYPDKWRDYSGIEIKDQPYVLNVLAASAFEAKRLLSRIGKPVDKNEWEMSPPTVNAYYTEHRNEIVFPAGILQPPLFDMKGDDATNYGGIGAVIGHEMTHGFDDQGRKFDGQGNMVTWWTKEDEKRFQERSKKIVEQFNSYVAVDDLHVNGELTQGENIADLGGVKIAYTAFQKALQRKPAADRNQKIDGLTPQQRFFVSFAQIWRANFRPEALRLLVKTNPHSPPKFRVLGPLSNLPEFAQAFHIPENSPMIRPAAERVNIW